MNAKIYPKLAISSIKKNRRLYIPYILTCVGMVMMFYIVSFLTNCETLLSVPGGEVMKACLQMGCCVIAVFAMVFLFYTNSFLIRRRKKEFGLYNILGMGKGNLAFVLISESGIVFLISVAAGLFLGILFSKFAELAMINILQAQTGFSLYINPESVMNTAVLFAVIFALLLINSLFQIRLSNPIDLLKSENAGEKPPKANWLFAVSGALILAAAYYIAVSIENPINAIFMFFVAVIMVIIATYILFISGSVTACRALQKNKGYYYKTNHFISVSSMAYRMKRNGSGLASICILCTMVLVTISTTVCMYLGVEDSLRLRYPRNIGLTVSVSEYQDLHSAEIENIEKQAFQAASEYGQVPENTAAYSYVEFAASFDEGHIIPFNKTISYMDTKQIFVLSIDDYNNVMHENETLAENEVLLYTTKNVKYKGSAIQIGEGQTYKIKKQLTDFISNGMDAMNVIPSVFIVTADIEKAVLPFAEKEEIKNSSLLKLYRYCGYNLDCDEDIQVNIYNSLNQNLKNASEGSAGIESLSVESSAWERSEFNSLYGSLFFLGVLLGTVFIFAAVLIIYYKQISEGYEDQSRFEIMQKVGMNKKEIKKSINSQVLTVFFLPLIMSAVHLAFAFPMIYRMLMLFAITNLKLLIIVTLCCFAVFALFYILVYKITSKAYYSIVSKS